MRRDFGSVVFFVTIVERYLTAQMCRVKSELSTSRAPYRHIRVADGSLKKLSGRTVEGLTNPRSCAGSPQEPR